MIEIVISANDLISVASQIKHDNDVYVALTLIGSDGLQVSGAGSDKYWGHVDLLDCEATWKRPPWEEGANQPKEYIAKADAVNIVMDANLSTAETVHEANGMVKRISDYPAAPVAEVVRCKDMIWFKNRPTDSDIEKARYYSDC